MDESRGSITTASTLETYSTTPSEKDREEKKAQKEVTKISHEELKIISSIAITLEEIIQENSLNNSVILFLCFQLKTI